MTDFSGLGIGLSIVFGCLLLCLVAELYYLLWWKKRITNREVEEDGDYTRNPSKVEFCQFSCWRKPKFFNPQEIVGAPDANNGSNEIDPELGSSKDLLLKLNGEENVEISELMWLHNLVGPPRFLFTIKEETKEDLESEDGRSRKGSRTGSLSDIILGVENSPFHSPLPPSPLSSLDSYKHRGFNPLFESSNEAEIKRLRSSPPPKFKFLRDAEEKLLRRLMEEAEKRASRNCGSAQDFEVKASNNSTMSDEEKDGSFIRLIVGKNKELHRQNPPQNPPPSSSKVLPLATSPTMSTPVDKLDLC